MDINYSIHFHSEWHCGSGLSAGADVDSLVIKDKDSLPFIPGKTLKGLIREAVEDISFFRGDDIDTSLLFGKSDKDSIVKGVLYFSNAELCECEKEAITKNSATQILYKSIASTQIDDNGLAKKGSLRKIEVTIPCVLTGQILNIPENMEQLFIDALGYIKRLGVNRNRGLGRCTIKIEQ